MFTLTVYRGDRVVQELDLEGREVTIGRSPDNGVVLADDGRGVSRAHATLRIEAGRYMLEDRNSQNGTLVGGKRIKKVALEPGQDFVIGPYRLVPGDIVGTEPLPRATEIVERTTPPPITPPSAREGTGERPAQSQTHGRQKTLPGTTIRWSSVEDATAWLSKQPPTAIYGAGAVILAVVIAVGVWALWPAAPVVVETPPVTEVVSTTTVTTTSIDPYAERLAAADQAITAADARRLAATALTGSAAQAEHQAVIDEYQRIAQDLQAILTETPGHSEATRLLGLATTAGDTVRLELSKLPTATKVSKPEPVFEDPEGMRRNTGETSTDYINRNDRGKAEYRAIVALLKQEQFAEALERLQALQRNGPGTALATQIEGSMRLAREQRERVAQAAIDEGRKLDAAGVTALTGRRFEEAARDLIGAWRQYERARNLQDPQAMKLYEANRQRRREVAAAVHKDARTEANLGDRARAITLFRTVISLLEPGEPLRTQAEADLQGLQ